MPEINMPRICDRMSPQQRIATLTAVPKLPIRGGWGYTMDDAVVITVPRSKAFYGLTVERRYADWRSCQEINESIEDYGRPLQMSCNLSLQALQLIGDKAYDIIFYDVCFTSFERWNVILQKRRSLLQQGLYKDFVTQFEGQKEILHYHYVTKCVFDVTSFFW